MPSKEPAAPARPLPFPPAHRHTGTQASGLAAHMPTLSFFTPASTSATSSSATDSCTSTSLTAAAQGQVSARSDQGQDSDGGGGGGGTGKR